MNGSLQQKHGKYYAVFSIQDSNGKRKTEWINTNIPAIRGNKRQAEQRLVEIISEREEKQKSRMVSKDMPFVSYIDLWLTEAKNTVDVVTYEGYRSYVVNHIRPYFEKLNLSLCDININDIEDYFKCKATSGRLDGKEGGLSHRSIELHKSVLSRMFGDAMREPFNLRDNPCRLAKIPRTATQSDKRISFYTIEQCKRLLKVTTGTPLNDMIYITFMYGLRRSELMGLKWDAVDFKQKSISICHTVVVADGVVEKNATKNKSSKRTYPILDDIEAILLRLKNHQEQNKSFYGNCYTDSGYVFTKDNGSPYYPSYPYNELKKTLKKFDLPYIRWHDLRHSCASMLLDKGWSMKDISDWLGHADIGTTMDIYAHLNMEHKRRMAEGLNGTLV